MLNLESTHGPPATPSMPEPQPRQYSVTDLHGGQTYWRALYYFNLYRLLLGTGMLTVAVTGADFALLGEAHPRLFLAASAGMLGMAVLSIITITTSWPGFRIQAYLQFSADAVLITLLSYASGGVASGLNLLLIVSVAAAGVVLSGRMSLFFAAFATLLTLGQQSYQILAGTAMPDSGLVQVGVLGIGYFSTGGIVYWLARGFHAMEASAQAQQAATARLDRLNEAIVSKSTVGIAVISHDQHCRLLNDQARYMLGLAGEARALPRALVERALVEARGRKTFSFEYRSAVTRIRVQGLHIDDELGEVALFLEDQAVAEREVRNLKLAALGRLTASVAHEIRNPLEAISHAGQLLAESGQLGRQDRKLTTIIGNQSQRINAIVKSVLQLGKPGAVQRVDLALAPWLERFREQFNASPGMAGAVAVRCEGLHARVDPDQLNQILTNLCDNARRQAPHPEQRPLLNIEAFSDNRGAVRLDILDRGPGVAEDLRDKIFEPFFTTERQGLGLGLFLARELAHNNRGELEYICRDGRGRFRLTLEAAAPMAAASEPQVGHG